MSRRTGAVSASSSSPPSILFSRRFTISGARRTGGDLCRCRFVPNHVIREKNDDTVASAHAQRHERPWVFGEHQAGVRKLGKGPCPSLSPQSRADLCPGSAGLPVVPSPGTRVSVEELQPGPSRLAVLVSHHAQQARGAFLPARCEDAVDPARSPQPRRARTSVHGHDEPQASSPADDGLCGGATGKRGGTVAGQRHRLPSDVSAHRPGEREQGSLRPALAPAAGAAARVLAAQASRAVAVPE